MSIYQRGKSWYYDFQHRGERYTGCIGAVSKTVAKEILAKKKTEAVEGRYAVPSQKPSPRLEDFVIDYFVYYRVLSGESTATLGTPARNILACDTTHTRCQSA